MPKTEPGHTRHTEEIMLELKNVGFVAEGEVEILKDVSLTINERFVAITGPNGNSAFPMLSSSLSASRD